MIYNINLKVNYEHFDVFKQKNMLVLQNLFGYSRLGEFIRFNSYGIITPLDHKNCNVNIELSDKYNRLKTNCLIYDLTFNKYNQNKFDKLFIYYEVMTRETTWYSYILYNSETGALKHYYYLQYMDDKLCQDILKNLINLKNDKLWDFYRKKAISTKNQNTKEVPTIGEYNNMKNYYKEFIKLNFYMN